MLLNNGSYLNNASQRVSISSKDQMQRAKLTYTLVIAVESVLDVIVLRNLHFYGVRELSLLSHLWWYQSGDQFRDPR